MRYKRTILLLIIILAFIDAVKYSYPFFDKFMKARYYQLDYYIYHPSHNTLASEPLLQPGQQQGKAVPILLYHGVIYTKDAENTQLDNFISQMEMLKMNGFQTITLDQFDSFLNGNFVLPPKPIIITFDDGRKDSYYTTDDILKKLGFSAVLFLVSGKPNTNDKFYLSWDDLKKMHDSGRWDIQSHGTFSHDNIPVDPQGTTEKFLYAREYVKQISSLESIPDYEKRVENDYVQNIKDIEQHLGYTPKYFAIPLNYYGERIKTNYPGSEAFNTSIQQKYYRMAFVEVYSGDDENQDVTKLLHSVYNYRDTDRLHVARIEVKNMKAETLQKLLEFNYPSVPHFDLHDNTSGSFLDRANSYFGSYESTENGVVMSTSDGTDNARVLFGDPHWQNYTVEATLQRLSGDSISLISGFKDDKNYFNFGVSGNNVYVRKVSNGISKDLVPSFKLRNPAQNYTADLKVVFGSDATYFYINDLLFYKDTSDINPGGFSGVRVWGSAGQASALIKDVAVVPNN